MRRRDFLLGLGALLATQMRSYGNWILPALAENFASPRDGSVLLAAAGDPILGFSLETHYDAQLQAGGCREQVRQPNFAEVADLPVMSRIAGLSTGFRATLPRRDEYCAKVGAR